MTLEFILLALLAVAITVIYFKDKQHEKELEQARNDLIEARRKVLDEMQKKLSESDKELARLVSEYNVVVTKYDNVLSKYGIDSRPVSAATQTSYCGRSGCNPESGA